VTLVAHLHNGAVLEPPWVTGELALRNLGRRDEVIGLQCGLPQATLADDQEMLTLIAELYGVGTGYVDAQLLAATRLTADASLWTEDKRLAATAKRLGAAYSTDGAA
jgi:hypothetical protein